MNNLKNYLGLAALMMGVVLQSCSDDDTPSYGQTTVQNSELKTILESRGYQFNEQGNLLLDDLAINTTTLDLSGTKLADLSELDILPNLTDVKLSNNDYGPTFDFAGLPEQITGIDLTGNEIYDYDNLVNVVVEENGDETVTNLREITKLYLPQTAKDNIEDLVRFYRKNKDAIVNGTIDMKMEDKNGSLQTYTTLRDVPDAKLLAYLQKNFPDILSEDQIDINKRLGYDQKTKAVLVLETDGVKNFEGIQYIAGSPYWEGTGFSLYVKDGENVATMPKIKIGEHVMTVIIQNIEGELDLSNATELSGFSISNNPILESVDLSHSAVWGQRATEIEGNNASGSSLTVLDCPQLKEIKLPEKEELQAYRIDIECLPMLEHFNMSSIKMLRIFMIGDLNEDYNLVYPELTILYKEIPRLNAISFGCSQNTFDRETTRPFLDKYFTEKREMGLISAMSCDKNEACNWRDLITQ